MATLKAIEERAKYLFDNGHAISMDSAMQTAQKQLAREDKEEETEFWNTRREVHNQIENNY